MVANLQRRKSAVKIEQSIRWNDTCCIDKTNPAELTESLSIMGDWYSHAEFCLVHIDSRRLAQFCDEHGSKRCTADTCQRYKDCRRSADEWTDEWEIHQNKAERTPNLASFADIRRYTPEWAEHGWTLQELVLSETTFSVNSAWELLARSIERLGHYYYIFPFILY